MGGRRRHLSYYDPGAVGSSSFWRPLADRLADLGEFHLFGFPGFGGLPADPGIKSLDDLFGWLVERLPPGTSDVIAQSMGGVLAARLALERPERVARLVPVATSAGVDMARLGAASGVTNIERFTRTCRPGLLMTGPTSPTGWQRLEREPSWCGATRT